MSTKKKISKREAARLIYVVDNIGIMGRSYVIATKDTDGDGPVMRHYWPLVGLKFDNYRAAQNIVNAVRAAMVSA